MKEKKSVIEIPIDKLPKFSSKKPYQNMRGASLIPSLRPPEDIKIKSLRIKIVMRYALLNINKLKILKFDSKDEFLNAVNDYEKTGVEWDAFEWNFQLKRYVKKDALK